MRITWYILALSALAIATPAMANVLLTNGDASFNIVESYSLGQYHPWTAATTGDADFKTDTTALDQAYKYTWGVRQTYGTNHYMDWFGGPTTRTAATNSVSYVYSNIGTAASGYFDATFVITLLDNPTAGKAKVTCDVTLFNRDTTGAKVFNLFNDTNLDIGGSSSSTNDTAGIVNGSLALGRISDPTLGFGDVYGQGATRYEVNSGTNVGNHCFTSSYDLATVAPAIPTPYTGDAAIGMQWSQSIGAQQSVMFHHEMSLNMILPEPATLWLLGLGGMALLRRRS